MKAKITTADSYISRKTVHYILNKTFPENKKFRNFHHLDYQTLQVQNENLQEVESEKVYYNTKLLKPYVSKSYTESFTGRTKEFFFHLSSKKFISNVLYDKLKKEITTNGKWLYYTIPVTIEFVLAILAPILSGVTPAIASIATVLSAIAPSISSMVPAFAALSPTIAITLPILMAGVSLIILGVSLYKSYEAIKTIKNLHREQMKINSEFEKELLGEQFSKKEFERKVEIKQLVDYITTPEVLLTLKDSMTEELRRELQSLSNAIDRNPEISLISKKVISEVINFNTQLGYDYRIKKKLEKIPESKRQTSVTAEGKANIIQEISAKIKVVEGELKQIEQKVNEAGLESPSLTTKSKSSHHNNDSKLNTRSNRHSSSRVNGEVKDVGSHNNDSKLNTRSNRHSSSRVNGEVKDIGSNHNNDSTLNARPNRHSSSRVNGEVKDIGANHNNDSTLNARPNRHSSPLKGR